MVNIRRLTCLLLAAASAAVPLRSATAEGLPSEYERLAFLGSTGTQYVRTGVVPNGAVPKVEVKYRFIEPTDNTYAFGYWDNDLLIGNQIGVYQNQIRYRVADRAGLCCFSDTATHEAVLNGSEGTVVDGVTVDASIASVADPGTLEYYAFARSFKSSGSVTLWPAKVILYYLKISLDGTLVRDFVPCRRLADGALGLYDLVGDTFYGNAGTGTFLAPVTSAEFETDFIRVKGLANTGTSAFIPTGVVPARRVPVVGLNYRFLDVDTGDSTYAFGYWNGSSAKGTAIGFEPNPNRGRYRVYGTAVYSGTPDTVAHEVVLNGSAGTTVDGVVVSSDIAGVRDDGTLEYVAFGRTKPGETGCVHENGALMQLYALTIRMDGELVRDFVPCVRRSDGEAGLFDRVEGYFYTKVGSTYTGECVDDIQPVEDESAMTVLPYIQSTGSEYIRTGVIPNGAVPRVEATFAYLSGISALERGYVFGFWSAKDSFGTGIGFEPSGGRYRVNTTCCYYGTPDTAWHTVVLNGAGGTTVDGAVASSDIAGVADPATVEYCVFGRSNVSAAGVTEYGNCCAPLRLKRLSISLDGKTVRDYVPVRRTRDGALGLYDRVYHTLYENVGSGAFTAPYVLSELVRLRYAESTGTQYVDTEIAPNGRAPVVKMRYAMTSLTDNKFIFGWYNSSSPYADCGTQIGLYQGQVRYRLYDARYFYGTADTRIHTIRMNDSTGTWFDGQLINGELKGVADPYNRTYWLFARRLNASTVEGACGRIYSFSLSFGGKTCLDLMPARRLLDNRVGLWDRVSGKFLVPAGGDLVAGPEMGPGTQMLCR